MKKSLKLLLIIFCFCSCEGESKKLFSEVHEGNHSFKKMKGSIKINDSTAYQSFRFAKNDTSYIEGFWGLTNDTIYFINDLLVYEDTCFVKFPILILNQHEEVMVNQSGNCEYPPVLAGGYNYLIKILSHDKDKDVYNIKHTFYTHSESQSQTTTYLSLSLREGILKYKENRESENEIIPWTMGKTDKEN